MQTILKKEVIDLDTLLCPKVEEIVTLIKHFTCALHSLYLLEKQKKRHCAKRKAQLYFHWLTLPANEPSSEKVAPSVLQVNLSPSLTVCSCITNDNQITLSLVREEKIESRGQSILRKQQFLCNLAEIETLKNIFPCLNTFKCTMSLQEKIKRLKLTPLPMHKSPTPVQVSLDDESLPEEIKEVVSEGNVESIVYYAIGGGMQANYKVTYKKDEKDSRYTTYDFFMIERVTYKIMS